jgi:hypothetical protein
MAVAVTAILWGLLDQDGGCWFWRDASLQLLRGLKGLEFLVRLHEPVGHLAHQRMEMVAIEKWKDLPDLSGVPLQTLADGSAYGTLPMLSRSERRFLAAFTSRVAAPGT